MQEKIFQLLCLAIEEDLTSKSNQDSCIQTVCSYVIEEYKQTITIKKRQQKQWIMDRLEPRIYPGKREEIEKEGEVMKIGREGWEGL